ncbi:subclass B3 metallo-beta-lactamase [Massilia sp. ST3]|uniref:subclass B3 metallo-beta-lactamase n=1 Tax=Massilia sp. ST3 TaxID=2824903 RepID=UPI001B810EAE|nr:subclass B3 metallo-beta-lactamase [Massilia sp. ST3]MBQ5948289.1 subclass B3 metallo-beta-lactamase [Massilia sp. ST3]
MTLAAMPLAAMAAPAINCSMCDEWNQPAAPFKIHGNTWYVGTAGLSSVLVTSPEGHVLIDGALPQSAPLIRKNIEALGFRMRDIKVILNSHPHFDHAGAIAELQRASGAVVIASPHAAQVLRDGTPGKDDPQYDPKDRYHIPKVAEVREIADGKSVAVGPLRLTVHYTPGHTPGGTSWSWESCEQGACAVIVYADSLTAVSADGFYYSGDATHPDLIASFRKTIARIADMPCDVLVTAHPSFSDLFAKAAKKKAGANPFVDPQACRKLASASSRNFEARIQRELDDKAKAAAAGR